MILIIALFSMVSPVVYPQALPEWYIPLREAVYEQVLTADAVYPIYIGVSSRARSSLSGYEQNMILSRSEYMMGRAYLFEDRKNEASARFESGMDYARRALDIKETAEAWVMLSENLSQNIACRSTLYAMANGLNVEKYAKNALSISPRNAAAQYLIAARWVYAPSPFNNLRRGIEMMTAIQTEGDMSKDDMFNVYSAIGYAYIQQKNNAQAREWLNRSLVVYPTNKFAGSLLADLR
ncbi:MAG: hypothetical protein FWC21_00425 [Treponema sp.]|nr:hypothetical protein [Treponema sp.]